MRGGAHTYNGQPLGVRESSLNSFWYKPLPSNAGRLIGGAVNSFSQNEATLLTEFARQFTASFPQINKYGFTVTMWSVPANYPTQTVLLPGADSGTHLQTALAAVPVPAGMIGDGGTDGSCTLWDGTNNTMYEFWQYGISGPGTCSWAGVLTNASNAMGAYPTSPSYIRSESWGGSASGTISNCGTMQWQEWIQTHVFNHAIGISSLGAQAGFVYPAWKGDGGGTTLSNAMPHGTIMRFDPTINLGATDAWGSCSTYGLCPFAAAVARAIQTYGLVYHDGSGTVSLYAEDVMAVAPYPALTGAWWTNYGFGYGGTSSTPNGTTNDNTIMNQLFSTTMQSHLQVLDPAWVLSAGIGP